MLSPFIFNNLEEKCNISIEKSEYKTPNYTRAILLNHVTQEKTKNSNTKIRK